VPVIVIEGLSGVIAPDSGSEDPGFRVTP
jgi:hypothetical protein